MLKCVNVMMFLLYKKFLILYDYILYDYNLKLVSDGPSDGPSGIKSLRGTKVLFLH